MKRLWLVVIGFLISSATMVGCGQSLDKMLHDASIHGFYIFGRSNVIDTRSFDYRVLVMTTRLPEQKTLKTLAQRVRLDVNNPSDVDTLFFFLPGQHQKLGAYAYADFRNGKVVNLTVLGERTLICSNWHPRLKANHDLCDYIEY